MTEEEIGNYFNKYVYSITYGMTPKLTREQVEEILNRVEINYFLENFNPLMIFNHQKKHIGYICYAWKDDRISFSHLDISEECDWDYLREKLYVHLIKEKINAIKEANYLTKDSISRDLIKCFKKRLSP